MSHSTIWHPCQLRDIHSVHEGIAWAPGANDTVLKTVDGELKWSRCTTPPGAEHLAFGGIQARFRTAWVMSSGVGKLPRVYKTVGACRTWSLVLSNPNPPDGFPDAILFIDPQHGALFGDPIPLVRRLPLK